MPNLNLRQRLIDPNSPEGRPRRAAYALPTFFTAGNILLGFVAIIEAFRGAMGLAAEQASAHQHLILSAQFIGWAILLDGLDGRIARLTNTVSEFGKEMDSLADVITFGIAPAVLGYVWGVQFVQPTYGNFFQDHLLKIGYFVAFMFLLCGAGRLARFNVQKNPVPSNPGRPDRKYFVGMPIPAAAGMVASVVFFFDGHPLRWWPFAAGWLALMALESFLMVSAWRYPSFKELNLFRPGSRAALLAAAGFLYLVWNFPQPVLLALSTTYVMSGLTIRVAGLIRRRFRPTPQPEHQVG
jgi:CDP-diacylglycerol--serine O-phosphatidyltransferase